jgi:SAM-dependent methyltransferase
MGVRKGSTPGPKIYWELAPWFHALTHPKSYSGEAAYVAELLLAWAPKGKPTLLELGSGGGNNAFHMKKRFTLTLTDVSPGMLAVSGSINPECEHIVGDMRTLRLKRQFDFVLAHDAIGYMTSERDLARAIKTAFVHCRPGGAALFQPDHVRETFRPGRSRGGHRAGKRALQYVEVTQTLEPGARAVDVDFHLTLEEAGRSTRTVTDRHRVGVFAHAAWLDLLRATGFRARAIIDPWKRVCFLARRAKTTRRQVRQYDAGRRGKFRTIMITA